MSFTLLSVPSGALFTPSLASNPDGPPLGVSQDIVLEGQVNGSGDTVNNIQFATGKSAADISVMDDGVALSISSVTITGQNITISLTNNLTKGSSYTVEVQSGTFEGEDPATLTTVTSVSANTDSGGSDLNSNLQYHTVA